MSELQSGIVRISGKMANLDDPREKEVFLVGHAVGAMSREVEIDALVYQLEWMTKNRNEYMAQVTGTPKASFELPKEEL